MNKYIARVIILDRVGMIKLVHNNMIRLNLNGYILAYLEIRVYSSSYYLPKFSSSKNIVTCNSN